MADNESRLGLEQPRSGESSKVVSVYQLVLISITNSIPMVCTNVIPRRGPLAFDYLALIGSVLLGCVCEYLANQTAARDPQSTAVPAT